MTQALGNPGSKGNVQSNGRVGFGVGNVGFLDSEKSKVSRYWRIQEHGTSIFVGRVLRGLWGGGTRNSPAGNLVGFGQGTGQQFHPMSAGEALSYLKAKHQLDKGDPAGRIRGRVTHPIIAEDAYAKALNPAEAMAEERDALVKVFGDYGVPTGASARFDVGAKTTGKSRVVDNWELFAKSGRFMTVQALSGPHQQLNISTFQSDLVKANKILALKMARRVAAVQRASIEYHLRGAHSTGHLIEATLSPLNRFPA